MKLARENQTGQMDNPFIESFNGSLQDERLNNHYFTSRDDAQKKIDT